MPHKQPATRFWFSLLVLGLALLVVWQPARAQDPPPETGWQTFSEPGLGFTIPYPPGWVVRLVADNTAHITQYGEAVALRSIGFFGPQSQIVFVDVWQNRSGLDLEAWLARYPPPFSNNPNRPATRTVDQVAGRPAGRLVSGPTSPTDRAPYHERLQFQRDDLVFAIEYAALQPDAARFERMLAGFRFSEPTQARLAPSTLSDALPPAEFGVQEADCCGIVDFEYNPFPCNNAGAAPCPAPPCGNCTWWVRYRRVGSNEANLTHCTGDAITWGDCANQYYPYLVSPYPETYAVTLYGGQDHLSFVELADGSNSYQVSDMSWDITCPARYYGQSVSSNKSYILHPDNYTPNEPPNAPELESPEDESWRNDRNLTLTWVDGGDPDDGPKSPPDFFAYVENDDWFKHSGWRSKTEWSLETPADGLYTWQVKASDGMLESDWSEKWTFGIDTVPPTIPPVSGPILPGYWYKSQVEVTWQVIDPAPGSGVAYHKWSWNDDTPDKQVDEAEGSATLGATQGLNYLFVQGWDRAGNASVVHNLGWFGYDSIAPTITFSPTNPTLETWYTTQPALAWTISDPTPGAGPSHFLWSWDRAEPLAWNYPRDRVYATAGQVDLSPAQGWHTLYLRAWDQVGNASHTTPVGRLGYDTVQPLPPQIESGCAAENSRWQNGCRSPTFTWQSSEPNGEQGSGVTAYRFQGGSATAPTWPGGWGGVVSHSPGNIAPAAGWGRYTLHVQARDAVGNLSSPATFGVWYDGSSPVLAELTVYTTGLTLPVVGLNLTASDTGSGVAGIRIANNNQIWSDWLPYTTSLTWTLAAANNPTHTLYAQVRDGAGNLSPVLSRTLIQQVGGGSVIFSRPAQRVASTADHYGISLDQDSLYTNQPTVTLTLAAPDARQMRFSNSPDSGSAPWQPYQPELTWVLPVEHPTMAPQLVYVWFKDGMEQVYGPYFDAILYDQSGPRGWLSLVDPQAPTWTLHLNARDDHSGVAEMRFGQDPSMSAASWQPYENTVTLPWTGGITYGQFRDWAGNVSPVYGTDGSDSSLTRKLWLPIIRLRG